MSADVDGVVREVTLGWKWYRRGDSWGALRCFQDAYYFWYHGIVSCGCGCVPYVGKSWEVAGSLSDYPRTPAEMFGARWSRGADHARMGWYLYDVCCRVFDETTGIETGRTSARYAMRLRDRASGRRLAREFAIGGAK